jgi:uncharacterized protein YjiS (DUF1127 family)
MVALARTLVVETTGFATLFAKLAETYALWQKRAEQRRELASLSFREINEIGIDQAALDHEIAKPFWQA